MYDLIVIGGGPAGLAAALSAYENGLKNILIIERDKELGGILNQCIHNGFGLHYFKEELTGPEYAGKFIEMLSDTAVEVMTDTMVLEITQGKEVHCVNSQKATLCFRQNPLFLQWAAVSAQGAQSPFPALARQVFLPQVRLKDMLILKAIWLVKELLSSAPATSALSWQGV